MGTFVLAIDGLLAVVVPIFYRQKHRQIVHFLIAFVWIYSTVLMFILLFKEIVAMAFTYFAIPSFMLFMSAPIFITYISVVPPTFVLVLVVLHILIFVFVR